ncbi:hypothetical protein [Methanosarcina vacuolata]|uniref:hypothetical protein n=1 Tax=Methanosarcina vacuolata TaxID=2215 RepID=UPI000A493A32|nr:hypothetical protein [Methanosarcina vacuolata]
MTLAILLNKKIESFAFLKTSLTKMLTEENQQENQRRQETSSRTAQTAWEESVSI